MAHDAAVSLLGLLVILIVGIGLEVHARSKPKEVTAAEAWLKSVKREVSSRKRVDGARKKG
jgi:hypothetical protein